MIKWVVGDGTVLTVGKFPDVTGPDAMAQPVVVESETVLKEIELEVGADLPRFGFNKGPKQPEIAKRLFTETKWALKDKDGVVRFTGQPMESAPWCVVSEERNAEGEIEYRVNLANEWIQFSVESSAQKNAPTLEESEKLMKEQQAKIKSEFSAYLKERSRRGEELGIAVPAEPEKAPKTLKFKRSKKEDDWEGEQEFSDDEVEEEEPDKNEELIRGTIEVEDQDVVDKENEVDEEALVKDTFGDEIAKIMLNEHQKENIDEEALDDELNQFATSGSPDDDMDDETDEPIPPVVVSAKRPLTKEPIVPVRKTSKEDQIRARVKGMFWRNEYKLKLKDILSQFPGLSRTSEEYQYLTKSLKELADVVDNVLHLKQQFRK